ncbi:thermonuclease family protein [Methyloligella sp. 2.7D]|uniref:thermonuclease family protein n=1 Tax=unclassified Methyloligella TaxID=2625955 RepID=UPI00157CB8F7|nr:thermonuclease family protein [Methyloligella sp. GL2]QKP76568.1 thermonuclease family protein [Methyloligella sp. GL2]
MGGFWSVAIGAGLVVLWLSPAAAQGVSDCALSVPETASVAEVVDGETVKLTDGAVVRLMGAKAPRPVGGRSPEDFPPAQAAKARLTELAQGKPVALRYGGQRTDRYGRKLAQVFATGDGPPVWLQGALLEEGLARAYSLADNEACIAVLLAKERVAREAARGLWRLPDYRVRAASDRAGLYRLRGRFVVVEGEVADVASIRDWTYVNFDRDWREDFTVTVARENAKAFADAGLDLATLKGKRIRVRGWLEQLNGPMIEADHAGQIEVLEPAAAAAAP